MQTLKVSDITRVLEDEAPLSYQESYDNSGLITGTSDMELKGILLCLDSTEEVIDEAIRKNCNLVIAHHPIVFSGLKKFTGGSYTERVIIKALKNDIAIYAIHTNLDNSYTGVNRKIAEKLNLHKIRILAPIQNRLCKLVTFCPESHSETVRTALFSAGAGNIGNYDECSYNLKGEGTFRGNEKSDPFVGKAGERHTENEIRIETIFQDHLQKNVIEALIKAHPYEEATYDIYQLKNDFNLAGAGMIGDLPEAMNSREFLKYLKNSLNLTCIRYTDLKSDMIKSVAVAGGSGSFLLKNAMQQKADVLVTADFKYHQFFDSEGKLMIADVGHYESEISTTELIHEKILKNFPNFAVIFSDINTNPVKYYF